VVEHGHRPVRRAGKVHRSAVEVDVPVPVGQPVRDLEGRIAQRVGKRGAQLRGGRMLAELDDQIRECAAVQLYAQQAGEERERDGGERERSQCSTASSQAAHGPPESSANITSTTASTAGSVHTTGASARRAGGLAARPRRTRCNRMAAATAPASTSARR